MGNSVVKLKVNSGYQIIRKTKKVDIGTAYELLNTKQQKNYTEAIIHSDYAELVWHVVRCPYCGKETSLYEKENKRATSVYNDYYKEHSKTAKIDRDSYNKYYQLVRNVCLSADGNYTVFLLPRVNESININYENGMRKIDNFSELKNSVKRVMWEDLLLAFPDEEFFEKYFSFMRR